MKINLPSIVGIALLTIGVIAGVVLVQSSQDIRNKAAELTDHKVFVCHKTEIDQNPWMQIEIPENLIETYLARGDMRGNCPGQAGEVNDAKENKKPQILLADNTTISSEIYNVSKQGGEADKKVSYADPKLIFWSKLEGIDKNVGTKKYRVVLQSGNSELHVYNNIIADSDNLGIFEANITDTYSGNFTLLIKPDGYLQKRFSGIYLSRGIAEYHFEESPFVPGDFDGDNDIDSKDLAELSSLISENPYVNVKDKSIFDVNSDGKVDDLDMELVLQNYNELQMEGDK